MTNRDHNLYGEKLFVDNMPVISARRNLRHINSAIISGETRTGELCVPGFIQTLSNQPRSRSSEGDGDGTRSNRSTTDGCVEFMQDVVVTEGTLVVGDTNIVDGLIAVEDDALGFYDPSPNDEPIVLPTHASVPSTGSGDMEHPILSSGDTPGFDVLAYIEENHPDEYGNIMAFIEENPDITSRSVSRSVKRSTQRSTLRAVVPDPALDEFDLNDSGNVNAQWDLGQSFVIDAPGVYKLSADYLTFAPASPLTHAIVVDYHDPSGGADPTKAVIIDLGGFTLAQSTVAPASGIDAVHFGLPTVHNAAFHQVAVQNGTIKDFTGAGVWAWQFSGLAGGLSSHLSFCDLDIDNCGELGVAPNYTTLSRFAELPPVPLFGSGIVLNPGISLFEIQKLFVPVLPIPIPALTPGQYEYEDVIIEKVNVTNAKGGNGAWGTFLFGTLRPPSAPIVVHLCRRLTMNEVLVEADRSTTDSVSVWGSNTTDSTYTNITCINNGDGIVDGARFFGFPTGTVFLTETIAQFGIPFFNTDDITVDNVIVRDQVLLSPATNNHYKFFYVGGRGIRSINVHISNVDVLNIKDESARVVVFGVIIQQIADSSIKNIRVKNMDSGPRLLTGSLVFFFRNVTISDVDIQDLSCGGVILQGFNANRMVDVAIKRLTMKNLTLTASGTTILGYSARGITRNENANYSVSDLHIENLTHLGNGSCLNIFTGGPTLLERVTIKGMRTFGAADSKAYNLVIGVPNKDPVPLPVTLKDWNVEDIQTDSLVIDNTYGLWLDDFELPGTNPATVWTLDRVNVKKIRSSAGSEAIPENPVKTAGILIGSGSVGSTISKTTIEDIRGNDNTKNPTGLAFGAGLGEFGFRENKDWKIEKTNIKTVVNTNSSQGIATGVLIAPGVEGIHLDKCDISDIESSAPDAGVTAGVSIGCNSSYFCDSVGQTNADFGLYGNKIEDVESSGSEAAGIFSKDATTTGIVLFKNKVTSANGKTPIGARSAGITILNSSDPELEKNFVKTSDRGFLLTGSNATLDKNKALNNCVSGYEDNATTTLNLEANWTNNKSVMNGKPCTDAKNYKFADTNFDFTVGSNTSTC